jgi:hypothetical protein
MHCAHHHSFRRIDAHKRLFEHFRTADALIVHLSSLALKQSPIDSPARGQVARLKHALKKDKSLPQA